MIVPLLLGLTLSSPDVRTGAQIAHAFVWNNDGCHGANRTPRLTWDAPPPGTRTLNFTVIDHDAPKPGGWVHWSVFHILPETRALNDVAPRGAIVLRNDFGTVGWGGPCPPLGSLHHYTFELQALSEHLRVLAVAKLVPTYKR